MNDPRETLAAERWLPTRFGESIAIRRMEREAAAQAHEDEREGR